jgi:hypothetical protein
MQTLSEPQFFWMERLSLASRSSWPRTGTRERRRTPPEDEDDEEADRVERE